MDLCYWPHYFMANRKEKGGSSDRFPLPGLQNHCGWWVQPWSQKTVASWQESDDKRRRCAEKQRHYSANKGPYSWGCGLSSGHIRLWELGCKQGGRPKNSCLWTVVLEKTPGSPLDSKKIKPVNLKGDQPWIFTGRTDAEAPVFWLSDANRWLIEKVPDAGKDWGQKEKRASEEKMAGRHHRCNEHELGQTLGEGGLVCCSPWSHKEFRHDREPEQQQQQYSIVCMWVLSCCSQICTISSLSFHLSMNG